MIELVEKALLAGVGALSLSQKKAEELLDELRDKYDLSEDKGREILERIRSAAEETQQKLESVAREEVNKAVEKLGLAKDSEVQELKTRIEELERQVKAS